ncbi:MAG: glycosyltransferase family 39 protein [Thermoproteota archaeon]|nr:glycosyltransferase family 39 protein [Thermoproteota archaeon]
MGLQSKQAYSVSALVVLIPIALSAYTHLWNPSGFPNLYYDEGVYMRRAMHVMDGLGPQEAYYYDHPFFGQIFLAGILKTIGYPESVHPSPDASSINSIYLVPRTVMGILAVIDTFLIYKVAERMYNKNVAILGSILFSVMPVTWFTRMILLDSILLPFLLFSVLLALYTNTNSRNRKNNYAVVCMSGIFLGLAIFTKIPAFTIIPFVGFLIYRNNKSLKTVGIWFIPVLLIPLLWPAQSMAAGMFDSWVHDVMWQISRENAGLPWIVFLFAIIDPVLFIAAFGGLLYSAIRKDYAILLWSVPFIAFLAAMGYANFFYWIPILPALCIGAAKLIFDFIERSRQATRNALIIVILSSITLFGLISTTLLIATDITSAQLEAGAYAARYLESAGVEHPTVISNPVYSWMLKYIFKGDRVLSDYRDLLYPYMSDGNSRILLIDDPRFKLDMGNENSRLLEGLYGNTTTIAKFHGKVTKFDLGVYPFTSMAVNYEGSEVGIRVSNSHT